MDKRLVKFQVWPWLPGWWLFLRLRMLQTSVTTLCSALIRCHHPLPCCCHQCPSISTLTENPLLKSRLCPTRPAVWPRQHGWMKLNVRGALSPHSLPYWPLLILLTNLWGYCSCLGLTVKNSGTSGRFFFRITELMGLANLELDPSMPASKANSP